MKNKMKTHKLQKQQKGVVLVLALIMLLLVTVIGVSVVNSSRFDTQRAGNSIYKHLVFQGAESALGRSVSNDNLYNVVQASERSVGEVIIPTANFPDETVVGGGKLKSTGKVIYQQNISTPPYSSVPYSSEFEYQVFKFEGESKLITTAAKDKHTEGRAVIIPKQ